MVLDEPGEYENIVSYWRTISESEQTALLDSIKDWESFRITLNEYVGNERKASKTTSRYVDTTLQSRELVIKHCEFFSSEWSTNVASLQQTNMPHSPYIQRSRRPGITLNEYVGNARKA